jgi:hypothetical protein
MIDASAYEKMVELIGMTNNGKLMKIRAVQAGIPLAEIAGMVINGFLKNATFLEKNDSVILGFRTH